MNNRFFNLFIKNINLILLITLYLIGILVILMHLYIDIKNGGASYRQGDWLINNELVTVRRGVIGSIILYLSNLIDLSSLYFVGIIQAIIVFTIFLFYFIIGLNYKNNDAFLFLLISPLFILFWFNDLEGTFRKEIITYLAFTPFLAAAIKKTSDIKIHIIISLFLYMISVLSHEANIFFFPVFILIIYTIRKKIDRYMIFISILYAILAIFGFMYALAFSSINDYMLVCKPLLDNGLNENICTGAIQWLTASSDTGIQASKGIFFSGAGTHYFVMYLLSIIFFLFVLEDYFEKKIIISLCLFFLLCFSPLFFIAIDWGRWINFYIFSLTTFIIINLIYSNKYIYNNKFRLYKFILLLIFCLSAYMPHFGKTNFSNGYIIQIFKLCRDII